MLPADVEALIREEQARQGGAFIAEDVPLDVYLRKLGSGAEIAAHSEGGRCRGAVAFYCNDAVGKTAFISLIVVDPRDRNRGLGEMLVGYVMATARKRGFAACRLEVQRDNGPARALYASRGFTVVEQRGDRELLEVTL